MSQALKAVVVGCGGISNAWLDAVKQIPDLEIAGLVDLRKEAADRQKAKYQLNDARTGTDLDHMLREARPDAVFDCTVPEAHVKVVIKALQHGCHVLGEKPLADSMANARRMVAAARKARRIYAVIQNRRYEPEIRSLRAFLDAGHIGPITTVNCDFYLGPHFGGFREKMKHVLLVDMAIHTFDAARLISGQDPLTVYCKDWNPAGSWYADGASAMAIFEMTGGVVFNYRGSWCANGLKTAWGGSWRIVGERGSVTWNGEKDLRSEVVEPAPGFLPPAKAIEVPSLSNPKDGGHLGLIREFVHCVRNGGEPETVCTDNIKSLAMVFGAVQSSETGRRVRIRA